jgi:hypothetical protein
MQRFGEWLLSVADRRQDQPPKWLWRLLLRYADRSHARSLSLMR